MIEQKKVLFLIVSLTVLLTTSIGLPVKSKRLSSYSPKNSQVLTPYLGTDGNITVNLKGLKKNEVPYINISTISDLLSADQKFATSVDFGALEELAELKPVFRGQTTKIKVPSEDIKQAEQEFKILTAKKATKQIVALLSESQILVPLKNLTINSNKQKFNYAQFGVAVSDTVIFTKSQNCYQELKEGMEIFTACTEYKHQSPYTIDYNPDNSELKFIPTYDKTWIEHKVYDTPLSVSYGRISGVEYKGHKLPKVNQCRKGINIQGTFVLKVSDHSSDSARAGIDKIVTDHNIASSSQSSANSFSASKTDSKSVKIESGTGTSVTNESSALSSSEDADQSVSSVSSVQSSSYSSDEKIEACMCDGVNGKGDVVRAENSAADKTACEAVCPASKQDKNGWCELQDGLGSKYKVKNCKWELTDPPSD